MRFLPYRDVSTVPNVIVDGAATQNTILTLSHWPKSGTPPELKGDTSAQIVFNYLDSPRFHVQADVVSNNTSDKVGLLASSPLSSRRRQPDIGRCCSTPPRPEISASLPTVP